MVQRRQVSLCPNQVAELQWVRDHHQKPYLRERAAAILKVADGQSQCDVAAHGLHKPHSHETISEWITRYEREGLEGLFIRSGRGRKPAFSPCGP